MREKEKMHMSFSQLNPVMELHLKNFAVLDWPNWRGQSIFSLQVQK